MSKWQAMRERETIHDFPCPREGWAKGEFLRRCYPELEKCGLDGQCSYEFVYRQYMALRAVVEAFLADDSVAEKIAGWRAEFADIFSDEAFHDEMTDALEDLL